MMDDLTNLAKGNLVKNGRSAVVRFLHTVDREVRAYYLVHTPEYFDTYTLEQLMALAARGDHPGKPFPGYGVPKLKRTLLRVNKERGGKLWHREIHPHHKLKQLTIEERQRVATAILRDAPVSR